MRKDPVTHAGTRRLAAAWLALLALACVASPAAASAVVRDTDGDRLTDRYEKRASKTNPRKRDTDRDGLGDAAEVRRTKTDPRRRDTDRDGLSDSVEVRRAKTDPLRKDTDRDGLGDRLELRRLKTSPRSADSDGDGMADGLEVLFGRDPLAAAVSRGLMIADPPPSAAPASPQPEAAPPAPSPVAGPQDTAAPDTSIISGPSGTVTSGTAAFEFTSSEAGSTFECRLDSASWGHCVSPATYSGLAPGSHTFRVRATDAASNRDGSPAQRTWTFDHSDGTEPSEPPPPPPGGCDLTATPADFASQVAAAQAGQAICLATGNYGTWTGTNKAIVVRPLEGATPTMKVSFSTDQGGLVLEGMSGMGAPSNIRGTAGNFTIRSSAFTSKLWINRSSGTTTPITLDGNTHNDISGVESRLGIYSGGTNVVVTNSLFQGGGSDGVRIASPNSVIGPGNRFIGFEITDSNHTDPIQFFSGLPGFVGDTRITGNYFAQPEGTGDVVAYIAAWDGTSSNVIDNNVFRAVDGGSGGGHGIAYSIALYADRGSVIRNNTMERGTCNHNIRCGTIMLASKSGYPAGTGTVIRDNVMSVVGTGNGSTYTADHNLTQGALAGTGNVNAAPVFAGPLTGWEGFRLASSSPGKGAASDGGDPGIR